MKVAEALVVDGGGCGGVVVWVVADQPRGGGGSRWGDGRGEWEWERK